jgi:drug/metabolite transporter (DMT)-like permease
MSAEDQSVRALFADLINSVTTLVRQELRLVQAEGSEKVSQATTGAVAVLAGLLVATCALLILLQALVIALAEFTEMPASLASLIVGLVLAVIAFVLIRQGQSNLSPDKLTPERTMRTLRDDKDMVMEKTR